MTPSLAVVIVTFDRPRYLREILWGLINQSSNIPFELVILDNGSEDPIAPRVSDLVTKIKYPVRLERFASNQLGPAPFQAAVKMTNADFVLMPGDDDRVYPNYIETMFGLANSSPETTLISTAMDSIDGKGKPGGRYWQAPSFSSQAEALAHLLKSNPYPLPASGFRRTSVDFHHAPRTLTSIDWWIWTQCWLTGSAQVSSEVTVSYRMHSNQESQQPYGVRAGEIDGARMILPLIFSQKFLNAVESWSQHDLQNFIRILLKGNGMNGDHSHFAPLLQMVLADLIHSRVPSSSAIDLFAQASAEAGSISGFSTIEAFSGSDTIRKLPSTTWSRIPVHASWECECIISNSWKSALEIPLVSSQPYPIVFQCGGKSGVGSEHELVAYVEDDKGSTEILLKTRLAPNRRNVNDFLRSIESRYRFEQKYTKQSLFRAIDLLVPPRVRSFGPVTHLERRLRISLKNRRNKRNV